MNKYNSESPDLVKEFMRLIDVYESDLPTFILSGRASQNTLQRLAAETFLVEKWPSHVAHVYLSFDDDALADRDLVTYIVDIIKAENLGVGSKGIAHSELARRFAHAVGVADEILAQPKPSPECRSLMDWCDLSSLDRPWKEALAVQIACESSHRSMRTIARGLRKHYNLERDDVFFWTVHGSSLEVRHSREGMQLLARHVSPDDCEGVLYAFEMSNHYLRNFYNAMMSED